MKRRNVLLGGGALMLGAATMWARSGSLDLSNLASRPKLQMPPLLEIYLTSLLASCLQHIVREYSLLKGWVE